MKVAQIASILNSKILPNILGGSAVVNEDLSNIVDIGIQIGDLNAYDKYIGKVINHIGLVKLADRELKVTAPDIYKEKWLYGSIMEMLSFELPDAIDNDQQSLTNGNTYNQDIFYAPDVDVKFYNDKASWQIPISLPGGGSNDNRIAQSFSSPEQCVIFWTGIELSIQNALNLQTSALIMRCLNYYIAKQMYEDIIVGLDPGEGIGDKTGIRCVNVLKEYNDRFAKTLKAEDCLTDPDFLKFAAYVQLMTKDGLASPSDMYNMEGAVRQTTDENLHYVTLSHYARATDLYLKADTYHNELVSLPRHKTVKYLQGPGADNSFESCSNVHVKVKAIVSDVETSVEVNVSGIIAFMFDDYAASVTNETQNVTSHYNARADFYNNYYSVTAGYNNMYNQNFVIFYVADES